MILLRVAKSGRGIEVVLYAGARRTALAINPRELDPDRDNFTKCEFFEVDNEAEAERCAIELAKLNPGIEVQTYKLTSISVCPPGEVIKKEVSKAGVLPVLS